MRISRGQPIGTPAPRATTFTGSTQLNLVLAREDDVTVNDVLFEPGARTHWHTHDVCQVLIVMHGEGRIQTRAGDGDRLIAGDVVHIPADEEHWHGATPDSHLLHRAISVGSTQWLEPVAEEQYARAFHTPAHADQRRGPSGSISPSSDPR